MEYKNQAFADKNVFICQFNNKRHLLQCKVKYNDEMIKIQDGQCFKLPCSFSEIWKQQKAEAVTFESRNLKLQVIDGFFESTKFDKVKGSNIGKCVQKKYFSYNRSNFFA